MNPIKDLRHILSMTQAELAKALEMTQGNVAFYERGQTVPPKVAMRLIEVSRDRGLTLSLDHVYGIKPMPALAVPSVERSCDAMEPVAGGAANV